MPSLSATLARLAAARSHGTHLPLPNEPLQEMTNFGSNPGNLGAWLYVPDSLPDDAPLVVVLHGCTQNGAVYNHGAGWGTLADELGFAVLYPEQRRANNSNLCFNWFEPGDTMRGAGEPLSIVQMIDQVVTDHPIDRSRIFVSGLSAGGAMAAVMLATYPDYFAGGSIIAGLPYGTARNVSQALERMRGSGGSSRAALAAAVRSASSHKGPWPTVSVWHGSADRVVAPSNADAVLAQWLDLHDLPAQPTTVEGGPGYSKRIWRDDRGRPVVEDFRIAGMGHGTPISTLDEDPCGCVGPHMLEAGISSTRHIAAFWGLGETVIQAQRPVTAMAADTLYDRIPSERIGGIDRGGPVPPKRPVRVAPELPRAAAGVGKVIEDALRASGLMR